MEPVMIKLNDLAYPSRKNPFLALLSMGEHSISITKYKVWE